MKKIYLILFVALTSYTVSGQVMYYDYNVSQPVEKVRTENVEVTQKNDTVNVSFDLVVEPKAIKSGSSLFVIPGIKSSKGEMSLPAILINGKTRSRYYKREQLIKGQHSALDIIPVLTLTADKKHRKSAHYSHSFIITPDMDGADLVVYRFVEDCCKVIDEGSKKLISEPLRAHIAPPVKEVPKILDLRQSVSFVEPVQEVVKERESTFQARISYPVNVFDVKPDFKDNVTELSRIDREISPITNNGDIYKIRGIRIEGYASPEGTWYQNDYIARNRANGFWSYLRGRYPQLHKITNVNIISHSEDWDGLVKMIKEEPMPYSKEDILSIIERYGVFNGREAQLMLYAGGGPYRYMLYNFFPKLRRIEITIDYDVKAFTDREAATILQTRPGDLSQYEMIRLARTQGSDILSTYDLAVAHFPNDAVALINASGAELIRGNLDKAWSHLSKVMNDPRAYNNIGVYYMAKGENEAAKAYFKAAMQTEPAKASFNLRLMGEEVASPVVSPVLPEAPVQPAHTSPVRIQIPVDVSVQSPADVPSPVQIQSPAEEQSPVQSQSRVRVRTVVNPDYNTSVQPNQSVESEPEKINPVYEQDPVPTEIYRYK